MMVSQVFIGLGSNRGDKKKNCLEAIERLNQVPGQKIRRLSSWYLSEPVGLEDPEWFINGVVGVETSLAPEELLGRLLQIETLMGRERTLKWGPRTIDLDLLAYDQVIVKTETLVLPHPQAAKRRFVLEPWAEIAPDFVHPVLKKTIRRLKEEWEGSGQAVILLDDGKSAGIESESSTKDR